MTQHDSSLDFRMDVVPIGLAKLRPYPKNPRTHSKKQIRQIADSIRRFGFTNPVLVSDDDEITMGGSRPRGYFKWQACQRCGCLISTLLSVKPT